MTRKRVNVLHNDGFAKSTDSLCDPPIAYLSRLTLRSAGSHTADKTEIGQSLFYVYDQSQLCKKRVIRILYVLRLYVFIPWACSTKCFRRFFFNKISLPERRNKRKSVLEITKMYYF